MQAIQRVKMNDLIVSVVVAVYNDCRAIRLVQSLLVQSFDTNKYEIIVVENGSSLLRRNLEKYVNYYHISEPNMPLARNVGLKIAKGKYILFTDADCVAHENWIQRMVEALEDGDAVGVGGHIKRYKPKSIVEKYGSNIVNGQQSLNYLPILGVPYVVCANSGFRSDIINNIGGFDIDLISGNDVDICYRIGLAGFSLKIASNAIIYHENRKSFCQHFKRFYKYSLYQVRLFKKYQPISGKKVYINPYPLRLIIVSLVKIPYGLISLLLFKRTLLFRYFLNLIEGFGVLVGDISSSIKNRVYYL